MVEWWRILVAVICLILSGLFSGLTLGLFALDMTDLNILLDSGTPNEVKYAKKIYPLRKKGNYLLCTLLIGNTAVNSALAIVTAEIFGGIGGFLASTFLILYIGEIMPQSFCHKHGLVVGAYAAPIVYMFMILTFPLSYPTAKVLDWFLGGESPVRYDKKQLASLVNLHGRGVSSGRGRDITEGKPTLTIDETRILKGALEFSQKKVEEIMTPLRQVFMLEVNQHLDFQNLMLVFQSGHSRVPVYERRRNNIIGVLFVKDILLIDPDDNLPVSALMNFFKRELNYTFNDAQLDSMLNEFKSGGGHLAVVKKLIPCETQDPYYETIGIVTLEDVIEELIGSEIVDETDVYESNSAEKKMNRKRYIDEEVLRFFDRPPTKTLQENEVLAVASFLSAHIEVFSARKIPPALLRQMLMESVLVEYKEPPESTVSSSLTMTMTTDLENGEEDVPQSPNGLEVRARSVEAIDKHHERVYQPGGRVSQDFDEEDKNQVLVYKRNLPAMEATLVITGRLEVVAGSDRIHSEVGPWTLLGVKALTDDLYTADFTARVSEYPIRMLKIQRKKYKQTLNVAKNGSILNKGMMRRPPAGTEFNPEHSLNANMPSRKNSMESAETYVTDNDFDSHT